MTSHLDCKAVPLNHNTGPRGRWSKKQLPDVVSQMGRHPQRDRATFPNYRFVVRSTMWWTSRHNVKYPVRNANAQGLHTTPSHTSRLLMIYNAPVGDLCSPQVRLLFLLLSDSDNTHTMSQSQLEERASPRTQAGRCTQNMGSFSCKSIIAWRLLLQGALDFCVQAFTPWTLLCKLPSLSLSYLSSPSTPVQCTGSSVCNVIMTLRWDNGTTVF
eukprot:6489689-Amphidinium_carterae.1